LRSSNWCQHFEHGQGHRQRQVAVAADAELRRWHPSQFHPPLRSAEPEPATDAWRVELSLTVGEEISDMRE
jgi:hypothetical protein